MTKSLLKYISLPLDSVCHIQENYRCSKANIMTLDTCCQFTDFRGYDHVMDPYNDICDVNHHLIDW